MSVIKVIRTSMPEDPEMVEINQIREEWMTARKQMDAGILGGACSVSGCRTMPFVSLRTNIGRRPLCLRHFEKMNVEAD